MSFKPVLVLAFLMLAGCASVESPAPAAPKSALPATKDARTVLVVTDEFSARADPARTSLTQPSPYQRTRFVLQNKTQGMVRVVDEGEAMGLLKAAGLRPLVEVASDGSYSQIRINRADLDKLSPVLSSQGIDYVVIATSASITKRDYDHVKPDRLKLIGTLGISYQVETKGTEESRMLDVLVWHCKKRQVLFAEQFQASDGGGLRENRDLDEWMGLAIVQKILPEVTGTERNPVAGDYAMKVFVSEWLRMNRTGTPPDGVLAKSMLVPVLRVQRQGDDVQLLMRVTNDDAAALSLNFRNNPGQAFCLDKNGSRYNLTRVDGQVSGVLGPREKRDLVWHFTIADRNVDFVNLHLKVGARLEPDFAANVDLVWRNIPLVPEEAALAPAKTQAPAPRKLVPVTDGSRWRLRDESGKLYASKSCIGRPVVVYHCESSLLQKTGMFQENSAMGDAAKRMARLHRQFSGHGILFLWIDDEIGNDPALHARAARKFDLKMPAIDKDEFYHFPIGRPSHPSVFVIDAQGNLAKEFHGASEIEGLEGYLVSMPRPSLDTTGGRLHQIIDCESAIVAACAAGQLGSFPVVKEVFRNDFGQVWQAVYKQASAKGIWIVRERNAWICTKSYIYEGYWDLLSPSRNCRHIVMVTQEGNSVAVEVLTPLWKHIVNTNDTSGRMIISHDEKPDYNLEKSLDLSRKFIAGIKKKLR